MIDPVVQAHVFAAMALHPLVRALGSSIAKQAGSLALLCFCIVTCTMIEVLQSDRGSPQRHPQRPNIHIAPHARPPPPAPVLAATDATPARPLATRLAPPMPVLQHRDNSRPNNTFVNLGAQTFYIRDGKRHHLPSCTPCSFRYTMCPSDQSGRTKVPVRILSPIDPYVTVLPQGPTFDCDWTPQYGQDGEFVWVRTRIFFVAGEKKHHVMACRPCGPGFTVCDPGPGEQHVAPLHLTPNEEAVVDDLLKQVPPLAVSSSFAN